MKATVESSGLLTPGHFASVTAKHLIALSDANLKTEHYRIQLQKHHLSQTHLCAIVDAMNSSLSGTMSFDNLEENYIHAQRELSLDMDSCGVESDDKLELEHSLPETPCSTDNQDILRGFTEQQQCVSRLL